MALTLPKHPSALVPLASQQLMSDSFISEQSLSMRVPGRKTQSKQLIAEFCKDKIANAFFKEMQKKFQVPIKIILSNPKEDSVLENDAVEAWSDMVTKEIVIRETLSLTLKKVALLWELLNLFFSQKNESLLSEKRPTMSPDQWAVFCMETEFKTAIHFDKILQGITGWKDMQNKKDHLYNFKSLQDFFSSQIERGVYSLYTNEQERFLKQEAACTITASYEVSLSAQIGQQPPNEVSSSSKKRKTMS